MPLQHLFSKRDVRTYPKSPVDMVLTGVRTFLRQAQFEIYDVNPQQVHGEQYFHKLGLRRAVDVWVNPNGDGSIVTLDISATLGDPEAAVGLLGAVIYLPLAVAVGAVSYLDYERDATSLLTSLWNYLGNMEGRPPSSGLEATLRCSNCGLSQDHDSRYCKRCGAQVRP